MELLRKIGSAIEDVWLEKKVWDAQVSAVDRHRQAAHAQIEEQCMGPDGTLDHEKADQMKREWNSRH